MSTVGIGGITLAGGIGFLVRKHGMTIDHLLAAEVVTADGEILLVDEEQHPDLFWALRGGGGNFGVVTRLHLRLHEVDGIVGGMLMLPATPEVIAGFVAASEAAPEELSSVVNVMVAPPLPFIPAAHHGQLVVLAMMVYAGDQEAGQRALAPFRELAAPLTDMVAPMRYQEMFLEEGPKPAAVATRPMFLDGVDVDAARIILDRIQSSTAPMAAAQIRVLGGAMARVPVDATAFAHRRRRVMIDLAAAYADPSEAAEHETWVAGFAAALVDGAGASGGYVGFMSDQDSSYVRDAYPGATWERLTAIKGRYDPTNLFRLNQNIPPAS